jgi:hypothetical protein
VEAVLGIREPHLQQGSRNKRSRRTHAKQHRIATLACLVARFLLCYPRARRSYTLKKIANNDLEFLESVVVTPNLSVRLYCVLFSERME